MSRIRRGIGGGGGAFLFEDVVHPYLLVTITILIQRRMCDCKRLEIILRLVTVGKLFQHPIFGGGTSSVKMPHCGIPNGFSFLAHTSVFSINTAL